MNLWKQFNPDKSLCEVIESVYKITLQSCNEAEVYAIVKRNLTRRELKCFVMEQGGEETETIAAELKTDGEGVEILRQKILKKFRRPALADALRRFRADEEETG